MSDYRFNVLAGKIETAKNHLQDLIKLKHWLDRGIFEIVDGGSAYERGEQDFAEMVLNLIESMRCSFLEEYSSKFTNKLKKFYKHCFSYGLTKEQKILAFAFIEDMFDGVKIKEMIGE